MRSGGTPRRWVAATPPRRGSDVATGRGRPGSVRAREAARRFFAPVGREVWGPSLYVLLFLATLTLFVLLAETTGARGPEFLRLGAGFTVVSALFWLIHPLLEEFLPRSVAALTLIFLYLLAAQVLILLTGGVESPFFFVYYLVLFTGAMAWGLRGALLVTFLVFAAFAGFLGTVEDVAAALPRGIVLFLLALMIGFLSELKHRSEERAARAASRIETLAEVGKILRAGLDAEAILGLGVETAREILEAERGALFDPDDDLWGAGHCRLEEIRFIQNTRRALRRPAACRSLLAGRLARPDGTAVVLAVADRRRRGAFDRGLFDDDDRRVFALLRESLAAALRTAALQADLRRSETLAAIGEVAAGVAHEIRNPLGGIEGFATLARRDAPAEVRAQIDRILEASRRANGIVAALLEYARDRPVERKRVDLVLLARGAAGAGADVAADRPVEVLGDATALRQVLTNLVENARQAASSAGDRAWGVAVRADDGVAVVEVWDRGPGLPPGAGERLFRPFFTTKAGGTGLGLAISQRIVERHGGRIAAERRGDRTVFEVRLPAAPPTP